MVEHHGRSQLVVENKEFVHGEIEIESEDCFVKFLVGKLKEIKRAILHREPNIKCTLLCPKLPPELIIEAAEKFLTDSHETHDKTILLATNVIAMGFYDLPIRQIIFTETTKYES